MARKTTSQHTHRNGVHTYYYTYELKFLIHVEEEFYYPLAFFPFSPPFVFAYFYFEFGHTAARTYVRTNRGGRLAVREKREKEPRYFISGSKRERRRHFNGISVSI